MAKTAIIFGILIALISPVSMVAAGHFTGTAMIPAGFGIALILLGVLALKPGLRMHAMHGAALVGVIGALGGLGMSVPKLLRSAPLERPLAVYAQLAMGILATIFVVLTVKSFIDARRARRTLAAV
jgi:hypothetical protein